MSGGLSATKCPSYTDKLRYRRPSMQFSVCSVRPFLMDCGLKMQEWCSSVCEQQRPITQRLHTFAVKIVIFSESYSMMSQRALWRQFFFLLMVRLKFLFIAFIKRQVGKGKSSPSHLAGGPAHRAALISDFVALSQTPSATAGPRTQGQCVVHGVSVYSSGLRCYQITLLGNGGRCVRLKVILSSADHKSSARPTTDD